MMMVVGIGILVCIGAFFVFYMTRIQTISSIQQETSYDSGYNLYRMEVKYAYRLNDIIDYGIADNQSFIDAVLKEALPLLPVHITAPDFGCSVFAIQDTDGNQLMGRNYDFSNNSSAMLVHCAPKDGYESVAFAALDNLSANVADENLKKKLTCLAAPFICLDGMNEKGVSMAVLTLDSEPTKQQTGKASIATTIAIRLVLDQADTTETAVKLLQGYGERYDTIEAMLTKQEGTYTSELAWDALQAAAQVPKEGDVTSNTQWSIVYDDTNLTAEISIRRDWEHRYHYDLMKNELQ